MARKSSSKRRTNKIEPACLTVSVITPTVTGGATGSFTADLSQIASLVNRRFYRQGLNWAVSGIKILTPSLGNVSVAKLPNTWVCSNAWEKAFRAWNKQQMDAIEEAGAESAVAGFRDFKIHADVAHVTAGFAANLLPVDLANAPYAPGEWEESLIVVPNVTADASGSEVDPIEYKLHMVGINNNAGVSRGMIEGYADSRAYPQSPDPVSPVIGSGQNWLRDMFDVGNDSSEITDNATDRNDNLPYPQVEYPGGEVQAPTLEYHDGAIVSATTIGGTTFLKGGNFPCGLLRVNWNPTSETSGIRLEINLVPGNHRGYLCEPMTEM
jgi:hypothetical protein